ncbi:MAG: GGDEF domain-containing protein [Motiliproteus sp.]
MTALIFGAGGVFSILFFNEIYLATKGFVSDTLPKIDTAKHLDITARDIDVSIQRLIHTGGRAELNTVFSSITESLDRLEILTAQLSQEGGGEHILSLNRASQAIRTQAQLVFQLSAQRQLLQHQVADLSQQAKREILRFSTRLMDDKAAQQEFFHGIKASGRTPYRSVLDLLALVDASLRATTETQIQEQRLIVQECLALLQRLVTGFRVDVGLAINQSSARGVNQSSANGVLDEVTRLFPLLSQQLQLEQSISQFMHALDREVLLLSAITAEHSQQVFERFQARADRVLGSQQQATVLTLCMIIVASVGLFLVHRRVVVRGFADRLALISDAMARVPSKASHTQVAVSGKDEIAHMARALEGLLSKALKLQQLAREDELTGLNNRRRFFELAEIIVRHVKRDPKPASILMMDIDLFKSVNDTYGHDAGDRALREFAQTCLALVRPTDLLARYGGEEFVLVLPRTRQDAGMMTGERIRQAVEALRVSLANGDELSFTLSIGMVEVDLTSTSIEKAMQQADQALYQAKADGRNRLVCWSESSRILAPAY